MKRGGVILARCEPSAGEPWLMTTSGFLSSPGGRMTLAIIDTPPAAGMRTTCSRVCAHVSPATTSASRAASIRSFMLMLSRTARFQRASMIMSALEARGPEED